MNPVKNSRWQWLLLFWPPSWMVLFSSAKDFSAHWVLGSPTLNAGGLHVWRKAAADRLCGLRRRRMRAALPQVLADQWDRAGFMRQDGFLAPQEWTEVLDELARATLPMVEMAQPPAVTRRANLDAATCRGHYPALYRLMTDSKLMDMLHYAAGYRGRPVIAVQCIHSDCADTQGPCDPQTEWHSDTFHSTAKAWLFLHPVGGGDGPLTYMPGSHRLNAPRARWEQAQSVAAASHSHPLHAKGSFRVSDADLAAMGYGEPMVAVVPGNTLIVADTSGFHRRAPSVAATVRVEIYFSLRRNPFLAGWYPSLLGLPGLREHWAGWLFKLYTWMHRRGIPSWNPRETTGLNEAEKQALRQPVR
jgi:hypothetical protein